MYIHLYWQHVKEMRVVNFRPFFVRLQPRSLSTTGPLLPATSGIMRTEFC